MLYESVYVQVESVLTETYAEETKKAVRDGLNMVMEKSEQFHPPFIGSLQVFPCVRCKEYIIYSGQYHSRGYLKV